MKKTLGVLLFPQFELLDVMGPLEMFGQLKKEIDICLLSEKKGLIPSVQGVAVESSTDFHTIPHLDLLLVPGGAGTRNEIQNIKLLDFIRDIFPKIPMILSVCTGAALLAKAGVLDHHRATTNKLAFDWVAAQGPKTTWVRKARWVDDGKIISSSGVSAGMDMSLYVIQKLYGDETAQRVAHFAEYMWNNNSHHDPFADQL